MTFAEGIVFGIISMLSWGFADFFVVNALKKTSEIRTFLWSQIIGIPAFFVFFALFFRLPEISMKWAGIFFIASFLGFIAYLSFYKALRAGKVSVVMPIVACWAAITAILSVIFLNEHITKLQLLGIALAISGAVLVSFRLNDLYRANLKGFAAGAGFAFFAAVAWGVQFAFIDSLVANFGWFIPIFLIKLLVLLLLASYVSIKKEAFSFPIGVKFFIAAVAILEVIAFLSYGYAISSENSVIVAPLVSASPAITVLLALIFFRESIELNQKVGIIAALSGIVILSL